jgi:hypothetical protein
MKFIDNVLIFHVDLGFKKPFIRFEIKIKEKSISLSQ